MTKSQIIAEHTQLVQSRSRNVARNIEEKGPHAKPLDLSGVDRSISILAQIHNPRISAKSLSDLNLN